jgi:hypothetical protein
LHVPSEHKLKRFLTVLAGKNIPAITQNQAFHAIISKAPESLAMRMGVHQKGGASKLSGLPAAARTECAPYHPTDALRRQLV